MVEFFSHMSAVMPTKEEERIKKNGMVYMFICIYSLYGYTHIDYIMRVTIMLALCSRVGVFVSLLF